MLRATISILLLASHLGSPVTADQNDPRLDALFDQLLQVENDDLASEATREIWRIWYEPSDDWARSLMEIGLDHMAQDRYGEALAAFNTVVDSAPDFAEGWNARATLHYLIGDYASSAEDVKRTLLLEPRHFGALSGLGLIYMELGDFGSAEIAFQKALEVNPHLTGARRHIEFIRQYEPATAL